MLQPIPMTGKLNIYHFPGAICAWIERPRSIYCGIQSQAILISDPGFGQESDLMGGQWEEDIAPVRLGQ